MTESPHTSWLKVLVLISGGVAVALQVGKVPVALPYLQEELGISLVQAGWIVSIFALVAAPFAAFLGMVANQFGHLRTAVFGLCLSAFSGLVGSTLWDGDLLLVSRVFEGMGYWLTATSVPFLIYRASSTADRASALAFWSLFLPTGSLIMMLISGLVLEVSNWRVLWILTSVLILIATTGIVWVGRGLPKQTSDARLGDFRRMVLRIGPIFAALCFGLYAAFYFIIAGFLPLIFIADEGFGSMAAALVGSGFVLMNIVGCLSAGWLNRKGYQFSVLIMIGAGAASLLSVLVFNAALSVEVRILAALCTGGLAGLIPSSLFGLIPSLAGSVAAVSVMSGMLAQGSALGQLSGPPLAAAVVANAGDWHEATPFLVALALGTMLCGWVLKRYG